MILVNTGNGKGKTTAALGLALRALGHNYNIKILQFMKKRNTGEFKIRKPLQRLKLKYEIKQFGRKEFVNLKKPSKQDKKLAEKGLDFAKKFIEKVRTPTLLVLDELALAVSCGLLKEKNVLNFLASARKIKNLDIVITGRNASKKLIKAADIVTFMQEKKYKKDKKPRKGIEY